MKYVDEYRRPEHCQRLLQEIRQTATRPWTLMEVCGGQTHGLLRYGIDAALENVVRLIHGPGCPVCVTPLESIDLAIELARRPAVTVSSFGDMLRVPGSRENLLQARAEGGNVEIVYSPLDAVRYAEEHADRQVVFFAVGFETTAPATALAVHQASKLGLTNFSLLVSHVRVQPAMEMLVESEDNCVQGFLAAGHVCTVAGYDSYERFVEKYKLPVIVTGFEPVDLVCPAARTWRGRSGELLQPIRPCTRKQTGARHHGGCLRGMRPTMARARCGAQRWISITFEMGTVRCRAAL
jgi:hydrogenase expression/formation protein HypD